MKPKPDCLMTMSDLREPPIGMDMSHNDPIKDILQDLIAESRAWLAGDHPEPLVWMLNRAERRLREVSDE